MITFLLFIGPYLRVVSLMVKGQPSGSTSYAPGLPATVEAEAAAPPLPAAVARQPYLQWINNSPICSATAMLFTTTVSLAVSTGHLSRRGHTHTTLYTHNHIYTQPYHKLQLELEGTWNLLNINNQLYSNSKFSKTLQIASQGIKSINNTGCKEKKCNIKAKGIA